jgi:CRISPR-associated exonuclease Cas4
MSGLTTTRTSFPRSSKVNSDADFLMISGLTHFRFCKRRWALVHIEQQWEENALTLEGHYIHEAVHDEGFTEKRGSVLLSRGMPVRSESMRVTGNCDMVELTQSDAGVPIHGREGRWLVYPVEYKRGRPDPTGADQWQLCCQAMCLEEMFVTQIPEGAIYYAQTKRRQAVTLTKEMRADVREALEEMHRLFARGQTPKVKPKKACGNCSLSEICVPELMTFSSAAQYVEKVLAEEKAP